MTHRTRAISYEDRGRIFWTLSAIVGLSCLAYIYCVCATTINIAERQKLERTVADLVANQGSLEFHYITLKNKINMDEALAMGFKEVRTPIYVSRTQNNSLGFATTRR